MKIFRVKELIRELQKLNPESEVVVRDPDDSDCVIELKGNIYYSEREKCSVIE